MADQLVPDIPIGLTNHIGEENSLDFVHEKDFGNSLEDFVDWISEGDVAAAGHRAEDRNHPAYLVAAVGVKGFAVARGDVAHFLLLL